jgi:aspartate aminotransferase
MLRCLIKPLGAKHRKKSPLLYKLPYHKVMANRNPPEKHINLNIRGMGPSATVAINDLSNAMRAEGQRIFKLGLGQSPFPVPEEVVQALQKHAHEKDYLPTPGLYALRQSVAEYTTRSVHTPKSAEDVLIGPGSKELMFLLQLVFYGDLVIPTPAWVSYAPQATIIGRRVQLVDTHKENDWRLSPERLESICAEDPNRPRLLILNYPSNPTGGTFNTDELKQIAKVARKYRVLLLSDEIYGELHHKGQHVSIARFYPEGTIVSSGLSKWCGAGGWRVGTFVFPEALRWLLEAMTAVASETYTSTCAPIQYASIAAFNGSDSIQNYLQQSRRILSALGRWCAKELSSADIKCPKPQGGFYLFPDFSQHRERFASRGIFTSEDLCTALLKDTGVAILPGSAFGRPSSELTTRIAYVDFNGTKALSAVPAYDEKNLDVAWLDRHASSVVEAIRRLREWTLL